ncbi:MAG: carbon-nitrogen hydrolase family protein [Acholeplasmatales bacterium]|nr:MAG: carbon-nitrogen hydrolase family protein [Acholeplasmatales bacterium]
MRVALASALSIDNDIEKNINTLKTVVSEHKNQVDLICFGEAFLQGFDALSWYYDRDKNIASALDSKPIEYIKTIAKENKVGIGFGFFEVDETENSIYCAYMIVDYLGKSINHFRRVSTGWKEVDIVDHHYKEGNQFHVFKYQDKKITLALCGDLWCEGNINKINSLDKDFILWPLHIDYTLDQWQKEKVDYINQSSKVNVPVLMVNNISQTSYGGAYHFNKNEIIDSLELGRSGVLIVDV